jgi:hypothetical protein
MTTIRILQPPYDMFNASPKESNLSPKVVGLATMLLRPFRETPLPSVLISHLNMSALLRLANDRSTSS